MMLPTPAASGRKPPLPPNTTFNYNYNNYNARVPEKHKRRLRRDLFLFAVIFLSLTYILRVLRRTSPGSASDSNNINININIDMDINKDIHPRRPLETLEEIPRNVYYLTKEAVQFCYIPKNACSALKPLLRKREGFLDWSDTKMIHGKKNGLQKLVWLRDKHTAMEKLGNGKGNGNGRVYRFVTIRDPFSRLVSAWQNKIAAPWPDQRADFWRHLGEECPSTISELSMPITGELMTLKNFLRCLNAENAVDAHGKYVKSNEHWRPQSELCALDYVQYNKYIRMEDLRSGVEQVAQELGWKDTEQNTLRSLNLDRKPVYEKNVADYFDEESIELARKYYHTDIQLLGYPNRPTGKIGFFSVFNGTNFHPEMHHLLAGADSNNGT